MRVNECGDSVFLSDLCHVWASTRATLRTNSEKSMLSSPSHILLLNCVQHFIPFSKARHMPWERFSWTYTNSKIIWWINNTEATHWMKLNESEIKEEEEEFYTCLIKMKGNHSNVKSASNSIEWAHFKWAETNNSQLQQPAPSTTAKAKAKKEPVQF